MFSSLGSGTARNTGLSEINELKRAAPELLVVGKQTGNKCTRSTVTFCLSPLHRLPSFVCSKTIISNFSEVLLRFKEYFQIVTATILGLIHYDTDIPLLLLLGGELNLSGTLIYLNPIHHERNRRSSEMLIRI
jgi:hypothetical protein